MVEHADCLGRARVALADRRGFKDEALGELVRTQLIELLCCGRYLRVSHCLDKVRHLSDPAWGSFMLVADTTSPR